LWHRPGAWLRENYTAARPGGPRSIRVGERLISAAMRRIIVDTGPALVFADHYRHGAGDHRRSSSRVRGLIGSKKSSAACQKTCIRYSPYSISTAWDLLGSPGRLPQIIMKNLTLGARQTPRLSMQTRARNTETQFPGKAIYVAEHY